MDFKDPTSAELTLQKTTESNATEIEKALELYKHSLRQLKTVYDTLQIVLGENDKEIKIKQNAILELNQDYKEYQNILKNDDE